MTMTSHGCHVVSNYRSIYFFLFNSLCGPTLKKHQSAHCWPFVRGIHRWPVNSPHKRPVTRKKLPFDDVIMPRHDRHKLNTFQGEQRGMSGDEKLFRIKFQFHSHVTLWIAYTTTGIQFNHIESATDYYKLSLYRGNILYDSAHSTAITMIKFRSDLHSWTTRRNSLLRASYGVSFVSYTNGWLVE